VTSSDEVSSEVLVQMEWTIDSFLLLLVRVSCVPKDDDDVDDDDKDDPF
jgi:hypothetical protein